ncbi:uncharacterized protein [Panulirus ornatus]|uniref:uncharacterized protein n=1 Tax=Panulirus ornatus TaxID=150431 RepID=UPI003A89617E
MATGNNAPSVADELAEMSLEDFLQQAVPTPVAEEYAMHRQPALPGHSRGRPSRCGGRRGLGGRGQGVTSPSRIFSRGGVRAGVMMAYESSYGRRHSSSHRTPQPLPNESVLTMGSRDGSSGKDWAGTQEGGVSLDMEAILTHGRPELTFVLNQTLPMSPGQRCHFLPVPDVHDVRRNTILKLLSGMLNSGERGVVYMGVRADGRVEGINCEAQTVAQFVEGLMKTIQLYLMPLLHSPPYGVRYTNVVTASGQLLNNVWVVELHAIPRVEHYYNPVMDMTYYIRQGTETKDLPFTTFCHVVEATAYKPFEEEVSKLEEKVKFLKKALEEKGFDTSSVGPHVCDDCWFNDCPTQCYGKPLIVEKAQGLGPFFAMDESREALIDEEGV